MTLEIEHTHPVCAVLPSLPETQTAVSNSPAEKLFRPDAPWKIRGTDAEFIYDPGTHGLHVMIADISEVLYLSGKEREAICAVAAGQTVKLLQQILSGLDGNLSALADHFGLTRVPLLQPAIVEDANPVSAPAVADDYFQLSHPDRTGFPGQEADPSLSCSVNAVYQPVLRKRLLTAWEEIWLARIAGCGPADRRSWALEALSNHNSRLVISIAGKFHGRMDFLSLCQEGFKGLAIAVCKFDPSRNNRLSTVAGWWIRKAIRQALNDQTGEYRIPDPIGARVRLLGRISRRLQEEQGYTPTDDELREEMLGLGYSPLVTARTLDLAGRSFRSLDGSIGKDGDALPVDRIPAVSAGEHEIRRAMARADLEALFRKVNLTERETAILAMRYGIPPFGPQEMILEEIAQQYHIKTETVRQIIEAAIRKLQDGQDLPHVSIGRKKPRPEKKSYGQYHLQRKRDLEPAEELIRDYYRSQSKFPARYNVTHHMVIELGRRGYSDKQISCMLGLYSPTGTSYEVSHVVRLRNRARQLLGIIEDSR